MKRVFDEKEAAEYLSISRSSLRQARMKDKRDELMPSPPYIKIGKSVRYLKEDIDRWLDSFEKHGGESK